MITYEIRSFPFLSSKIFTFTLHYMHLHISFCFCFVYFRSFPAPSSPPLCLSLCLGLCLSVSTPSFYMTLLCVCLSEPLSLYSTPHPLSPSCFLSFSLFIFLLLLKFKRSLPHLHTASLPLFFSNINNMEKRTLPNSIPLTSYAHSLISRELSCWEENHGEKLPPLPCDSSPPPPPDHFVPFLFPQVRSRVPFIRRPLQSD